MRRKIQSYSDSVDVEDPDLLDDPPESKWDFCHAPASLVFHPELGSPIIRLFCLLSLLANNERGHCWASDVYISARTNIKTKWLQKLLKQLEDHKFIRRTRVKIPYKRPDGSTRYKTERRIFIMRKSSRKDKNVPLLIPSKENNTLIGVPLLRGVQVSPPAVGTISSKGRATKGIDKSILGGIPAESPEFDNISFQRKSPKSKPEPTANPFVEYWNAKGLRQHKITSKTYQRVSFLIQRLQKGKFGDKREFDPKWLAQKKEYKTLLSHEWTDAEIKTGIDNLVFLFSEGCWPEDKTWVPRDLPTLIYNPRTKKSMLICCFVNGKIPLRQTTSTELFPRGTTILLSMLRDFGGKSNDPKDLRQMLSAEDLDITVRTANTIHQYSKRLIDKYHKKRQTWVWEFENEGIFDHYYTFVMEELNSSWVEPWYLGPKSNHWKRFLTYLGEVLIGDDQDYSPVFTV